MLFRKTRIKPQSPAGQSPSAIPPERAAFFSAYGGFWTDLRHGNRILQGKRELGWVSDEEAAWLDFWMDNGFVVLNNAVGEDLIDAVRRDIDAVVGSQHEMSRVSYWQGGEKHFEKASAERMAQHEAKLLDMHMLSDAARQAIYAPKLLRFLQLVFERRPNAFQSLTFEYGSQQPVHCDVAFVPVSSPREFVASWIALEDIAEGTGELEYFPGSHRLEDRLFGGSPWASGNLDDYSESLAKVAADNGLKLQRFLPRKGDVLLWNAGLYHGGSKCTGERRTRRSLVTHYCPADRYPMYADESFRHVIDTPYGGSVSGCYPADLQSV